MNKHANFFECDCHTHFLRVEYDEDYGFWFSMLEGMTQQVPILHRLRMAMRMLFTGDLYHDDIILNMESASELAAFISKEVIKCDLPKGVIL